MAGYAPLGYYAPLGTSRYLGAPSVLRANVLFGIEIDWDQDGQFNGSNESRFLVPGGIETNRGRENFINGKGSGFTRIDKGVCDITLDNSDGRYSPRKVDSPLYPNLLSNEPRLARVWVKDGDSGSKYDWITGKMVDFHETVDSRGRSSLRIRIEDGMRDLHKSKANVDMQTNIRTDEAIGMVLDDIGWEWGRDLERGADVIPYWWVYDRSAYAEIMDLAESEFGQFFIAADGAATFQTRHHSSVDAISLDSSEVSQEIFVKQPSETVRDKVIVKVHPLIQRATGVLWTLLDNEFFVRAGETRYLFAEYSYNNKPVPALSVNSPIQGTDYQMNSLSGGGGTDLTSEFDVSLSSFGKAGKLTIKNNSTAGGYVTLLQVQGIALDAPNPVSVTSGNGGSVLTIDLAWQQLVNTGQDLADLIKSYTTSDSYFLTLSFEDNPIKQFGFDLMGWFDISILSKGILDSFRVSKIRQKLVQRRVIVTTLWLEPYTDTSSTTYTQLPFQLSAQISY